MDDVLNAYRRHLKARQLRPASITAYLGWLTRLDDWAECGILALERDDLEEWIASHDWAPSSHHKCVQALKAFYGWAVESDRITVNPAAPLKGARVPRAQPKPCPEDVYDRALADAVGQDWWRLRLAGETGLRRAELAAVHSADVKRLHSGPMLKVVGKGGVTRHVPLPEDLATWIEMQHGYVFNKGTGHMHPNSVARWYSRRLGVNVHSLRHRYATLAYSSDKDLSAVRELLGHASVATTQVYVAVGGEDLAAAARGAWMAQQPGLRVVE